MALPVPSLTVAHWIEETPTGFRIQAVEARPDFPIVHYDLGDWPLCRAAAEVMAAELASEILSTHRLMAATYMRPSQNP